MNKLEIFGKFLDQPILTAKFQKSVPAILAGTTVAYTGLDTIRAKKENKKETAIRTGVTLGVASLSAVTAPYIASYVTKRALNKSLSTIKKKSSESVDEFIANNKIDNSTRKILNKAKKDILSCKEIKVLYDSLSNQKSGKDILNKLIPPPKKESAQELFSQIKYLSVYGAVPVVGGIAGGISADRIIDKKHWKSKVPDKIKEGAYQYLANIFLCNIGAGVALGILEKSGIKSKAYRAIGMTLGIVATGIVGGSKIANFLGKKFIDPICNKYSKADTDKFDDIFDIDFLNKNKSEKQSNKNCSKERTPELVDIGLHTDDIATVSLLSGLKWIEPALPLMYTVSGYRAGIGYRN